jgi:predicted AlkP superfamily phosphohydrolase/phosphomutase
MTKLLVIGIDGASWSVIRPNLGQLPNFKRLMGDKNYKSLLVKDVVLSAAIWATIFSGKNTKEHGHAKYVKDGELQSRENLSNIEFVWDTREKKREENIRSGIVSGIDETIVVQAPFVMPPYNFNCNYEPIGYGASSDLDELKEDTEGVFKKSLEILKSKKDLGVFIVVFGALDKVQHFHWGESIILDWYKKMDKIIGELEKYGEKMIIISDHGFCSRGEARVQTLPEKNSKGEPLKGDHHEEAILITKNIDIDSIKEHKDIYNAIINNAK